MDEFNDHSLLGETWTPPDVEVQLQTRIAGSFVDEFVLGHSPADILRELVQNEFDAGGHAMAVLFGEAALSIQGTGRPVTKDGWPRLAVIAGTGRTVGEGTTGEHIEAKVNGIGSKNFGLRSLFLYGDRIHVRSAGEVAVLDLPKLATARVRDAAASTRKGVALFVPYRVQRFDKLPAFTLQDEEAAFGAMSGAMLATLAKLATLGKKKGLRELTLRSERLDRSISWNQRVAKVECRVPGVDALKRSGRMGSIQSGGAMPAESFNEIEFGRSIEVPAEFAERQLPEYFRRPAGRIRIAVSFPLDRGRLRLQSGRYFYPLQTPRGGTGASIDISAPFELNGDRSALLPRSEWNDWLCKQAAALVVKLLTGDWYARYGPAIYEVLLPREPAEPGTFKAELDRLLSIEPCWPTASPKPRERFARACALAIPADQLLAQHIPAPQCLGDELSGNEGVVNRVVSAGGKRFTINSLIRRRCAAEDPSALQTLLGADEADLPFDDYQAAMTSVPVQVAMAETLQALSRRLSPVNRKDLKDSPSTLTRSMGLRSAGSLVRVDPTITSCPQPPDEQLHPALYDKRSIAQLCSPFDEDTWIRLVCERAAAGNAAEDQRLAVEARVLASDRKLDRRTVVALKRSPVFRDHRGQWTAPAEMRLIKGRANAFFLNALSAPSPALVRNDELTSLLRVREELDGDDMVATAEWVAANPDTAEQFEAELDRRLHLLSRPVVKRLRTIAFLRTSAGALDAPALLHEANELNWLCVPKERIAGSNRRTLHERLGIRLAPDPNAVIETLVALSLENRPPPSPEHFYALLARMAVEDRQFGQELSSREILWVDGSYHSASGVIASPLASYIFDGAVPIVRGPARLVNALNTLGAPVAPHDQHWRKFFEQIGDESLPGARVNDRMRRRLLEAYAQRGANGLPVGLGHQVRCLLDRRGVLHTLEDLEDGALVENDFGALADAVDAGDAGVGIADVNERSAAFFAGLGLRRLTTIAGAGQVGFGARTAAPRWFGEDQRTQLLAELKQPMMKEAVFRLASHHWRDGSVSEDEFSFRLDGLQRIEVFDRIEREYALGNGRVSVPVEVGVTAEILGTVRPRTWLDIKQLLAHALAELVGHVDIADVRQFAALTVPLLMCKSKRDIEVFLSRQGIIVLDPASLLADDGDATEIEDIESDRADREELVEDAFSDILNNVMSRRQEVPRSSAPAAAAASPPPPPPAAPAFTLPSVEDISVTERQLSGSTVEPRQPVSRGYSYGYSGYTPPSPQDTLRDNLVGQRGEEIVYALELERVRAMGYQRPEEHVLWIARSSPSADHDIQSIDEDGAVIWIEVKATTGSDGRFFWPKREFEKAVAEGDRYELCRVYLASSYAPQVKRFRNPIALLRSNQILLDLNELKADVEPL